MKTIEQAREQKELGNAAYRQRDLPTAAEHYRAAIRLDPTNMTYVANMAAVLFEQGAYGACVEMCNKAVAVGREHRADFKDIAKALRRAGNAHLQLGELESAKTSFEKALSEHRTPETKALLSGVVKQIKEAAAMAMIDPEKAEAENKLGNDCFKKGSFGEALQHYTAAILCNPSDPRYLGNRAAAYTKLAEFGLALKDSDACIALDPRFVKGWLRRGSVLQGMREFGRAQDAFSRALELDPGNADARHGIEATVASLNSATPAECQRRALADPEVCAIMADPSMITILHQIETDPKAAHEHMKNPAVAEKLHKLFKAGIIVARNN